MVRVASTFFLLFFAAEDVDEDMKLEIDKATEHLYGLIHARYILTTRGLSKMVRSASTTLF